MTIEKQILGNLLTDVAYLGKVLPFLTDEYFQGNDKIIFEEMVEYYGKYGKPISKAALIIEASNRSDIDGHTYDDVLDRIEEIDKPDPVDSQWLVDATEEFCKAKSVFNAIRESVEIIEGKHKTLTREAVPQLLQDALAVSFINHIGHDYIEDAEARYEYYHESTEKIPFDIDILNKITKGGLIRKTLNGTIAESGAGKSAFMCHFAASAMRRGYNVIYFTMEMAEEKISERIDANMMRVDLNDIEHLTKDAFMSKIERIKSKVTGKIVVKEFPTSTAHAGHMRAVIEDLKVKKGFKADLVIVDYLNICCSARIKMGGSVNSYQYVKFIAEELRGLAVEQNVAMWTATQTNRSGYSNSDVSMTDTSESMGLVHTLDLYLAQMAPEELQELDQMLFKQLKNRYNDPNFYKRFVVGFKRPQMTFYDVEESAQEDLTGKGKKEKAGDDKPLFDSSTFGNNMKHRGDFGSAFNFDGGSK